MRTTEAYVRTTPAADPAALELMKNRPEVLLECLDRSARIHFNREEIVRIHQLPSVMADVEAVLMETQKKYYDEVLLPSVARLAHGIANRANISWDRVVSDRIANIVFAMLPPEIITDAIKALVPPEGGVTEKQRGALRAKTNKALEADKAWIRQNISEYLLHEGDFNGSKLQEAWRNWRELSGCFDGAVDPWGVDCSSPESPWSGPYQVLQLRPNENGRFRPAKFDPFYYK
jgi:hypothetical protein